MAILELANNTQAQPIISDFKEKYPKCRNKNHEIELLYVQMLQGIGIALVFEIPDKVKVEIIFEFEFQDQPQFIERLWLSETQELQVLSGLSIYPQEPHRPTDYETDRS